MKHSNNYFLGTLKGLPRINEISTIFEFQQSEATSVISVAERKGLAHPDSLCDEIAITMSKLYSRYCIEKFGFVLNHNFDKFALLGGEARVSFGGGQLLSPVRAVLNGRASLSFDGQEVPTLELMKKGVDSVLAKRMPEYFKDNSQVRYIEEVGLGASPGQVYESDICLDRANWFRPGRDSLPQYMNGLVANDTSMGTATWPLSDAARLSLKIEHGLLEENNKCGGVFGLDSKVMVYVGHSAVSVTFCMPQIARLVSGMGQYIEHKIRLNNLVENVVKRCHPDKELSVMVNARDDYQRNLCYLTLSGSSIESGDEGVVGRGNRLSGVIDPLSCQNMEGFAGKNPVYHVGLIYNILALEIAKSLHAKFDCEFHVLIISATGKSLYTPRSIIVKSSCSVQHDEVKELAYAHLERLPFVIMEAVKGNILSNVPV